MAMDDDSEGCLRAFLKVLSRQFHTDIEEDHERPQDGQYPG
jgi:hypothetical protein